MPLDATDWQVGAHDRGPGGGPALLIAVVALIAGVLLFLFSAVGAYLLVF